jgi:hypothetical protein
MFENSFKNIDDILHKDAGKDYCAHFTPANAKAAFAHTSGVLVSGRYPPAPPNKIG